MYLVLTVASLLSVFPLYYMFCASTNRSIDVIAGKLIPGTYLMENFKSLIAQQNLRLALWNSFRNATVLTVLCLLVCSIAGYGFEIYHDKAKDSVFTVDGKNVLLDYSDKERRIAELLKEELGGKISLVPRVLNPQGISTPDYIFRDEAFDLKELSGTSKNLVYNAIAKKKRQAPNFILDISKSPLDENEIARQIEEIYWSRHTMFVQKIIVIKDEKIRKIYKRNREK